MAPDPITTASTISKAATFLRGLLLAREKAPSLIRRLQRFLGAAKREKRRMRVLHQGWVHCLRDTTFQALDEAREHPNDTGAQQRLRKSTQELLQCICNDLEADLSENLGCDVTVCVGTCQTGKTLLNDSDFLAFLEGAERRSEKSRDQVLDDYARAASFGKETAATLFRGEQSVFVVSTRVRSKRNPEESIRGQSSLPFWVIKHSPAHSHFADKDPDDDGGVYCPNYDLKCTDKAEYSRLAPAPMFKCCREDWWEYYRSVAVFPIRCKWGNSAKHLVGFLWIDSLKPRAFAWEFERPGHRSEWSATMNLVQAAADVIATLLIVEASLTSPAAPLAFQTRKPGASDGTSTPADAAEATNGNTDIHHLPPRSISEQPTPISPDPHTKSASTEGALPHSRPGAP